MLCLFNYKYFYIIDTPYWTLTSFKQLTDYILKSQLKNKTTFQTNHKPLIIEFKEINLSFLLFLFCHRITIWKSALRWNLVIVFLKVINYLTTNLQDWRGSRSSCPPFQPGTLPQWWTGSWRTRWRPPTRLLFRCSSPLTFVWWSPSSTC